MNPSRIILLTLLVTCAPSCEMPSVFSTPVELAGTFIEPVTLASEAGVLEVNLFARQGTASLDTVSGPVHNFLLFSYEVLRGSASNGRKSDTNLYPGPTLLVQPGETLFVHLHNEMVDLTIPDFMDPAFIPKNQPVPLYPRQLTSTPINLHVHGLHVSPRGNSDNVLLDIPAGYTNTYTYQIPDDHPQGMYWYHSHRHQITAQHTYLGLTGLLVIGRSDGNLPVVTSNDIPVRNMALQYNYVFGRESGQAILNNPNWSKMLSTLRAPDGSELAEGTYEPKLTPTSFRVSPVGTKFLTIWYTGPVSLVDDNRGQLLYLPTNLKSFTSSIDQGSRNLVADPSMPDALRDVQYTVNGQFQPTLRMQPGQTEIWVLANISDQSYMNVTLTETATGRHPPIAIVGQDGQASPKVRHPIPPSDGTTLLIPPASRFAIAVTMPQEGDLILEMPPSGQPAISAPGILYTNHGTDRPSAVLGTIDVDPSAISYHDGFFVTPTQMLLRVKPLSGSGTTTPFIAGQPTGASSPLFETQGLTPDVERTLIVTGGYHNNFTNPNDPKAFVYELNGNNAFPYVPLIQPRLGSVEEWSYINKDNDSHPIHIHVNDFQVSRVVNSREGVTTGFQEWTQDNVDLPVPKAEADGITVAVPSELSLRTKFVEFGGTYVTHCHRLNHEDNGMMTIVNVIPAISSFGVATVGSPGSTSKVRVYDGESEELLAVVTPFPGFEGTLSVVMGDVDGDQVLDLIVGGGEGGPPEVVVYSGANTDSRGPFKVELLRFLAFDAGFEGGVNVAAANIDGNPLADNLIVGSGPGIETSVKVYSSTLPATVGAAPPVFGRFTPYPGSTAGVSVTAALFDVMAGRSDIVTAPGPGTPAELKSFRYDLYKPNASLARWCSPDPALVAGEPRITSTFLAFDNIYRGGVSLGSGWIAGSEGGSQSLVVGQLGGPGRVRVFTTGSALFGQPIDYLDSPDRHVGNLTFTRVSEFTPFEGSPRRGVRVATTSHVYGAHLLVSGFGNDQGDTVVHKYELARSSPRAMTLAPTLIAEVESNSAAEVPWLGGD